MSLNSAIVNAQGVGTQNEREISPMQLSLEQLQQYKQQHEEELQQMKTQLQSLYDAQSRYLNAKSCLRDICSSPEGSTVLVPLNNSLYVPGKSYDQKKVIVELGTGYFCEKTEKEAGDLIERKLTLVLKSIESIEGIAKNKDKNLQQIVQIMKFKMQQSGGAPQVVN